MVTMVEDRPEAAGYAAARKAMIDSQLRTSGVSAEFVIARMGSVAREEFLPEQARGVAYMDRAVPLGNGRYLPAPLVQGLMLQQARPRIDDKVLLVDAGSGYMAELLRPLVGTLKVVDPAEAVAPADAGVAGDEEQFTLLVIDGAIEQLPDALVRRLAPDGRVVTGLLLNGVTRVAIGRKAGGEAALLPVAEIGMPVLSEFNAPKRWSF